MSRNSNGGGNNALGCLFAAGLVVIGLYTSLSGNDGNETPTDTYESDVVESEVVESDVLESDVVESTPVYEEESDLGAILGEDIETTLTAADIPEFDGESYSFEVNDNQSGFSDAELSFTEGWFEFEDLDELNRVGQANSVLSNALMPSSDEERGSISNIKPTGWKNKRIENGGYLYNRSHLIANRFLGDDSDVLNNLMTGTRDMNSDNDWSMTTFEEIMAKELKNNPDALIRYQVTPIFKGDELLARGVQLRGKSIHNDSVDFNVFIYNEYFDEDAEVTLDFSDGSSVVNQK